MSCNKYQPHERQYNYVKLEDKVLRISNSYNIFAKAQNENNAMKKSI